jgi:hypothetical protein
MTFDSHHHRAPGATSGDSTVGNGLKSSSTRSHCGTSNLVDEHRLWPSASAYLNALAAIGVLEEIRAGRERVFINPVLLELLTADSEPLHEAGHER